MSENKKLNEEELKNAAGGDLDPNYDTANVTAIVFVNPLPDDPRYENVWDDVQEKGMSVYEISEGRFAVAKDYIEPLNPGDSVYIRNVRGYYGWEIKGKVDEL